MNKQKDEKKHQRFLSALENYETKVREALERDSVDIGELQSEWQERDSPAERALRDVEWNQFSALKQELSEIQESRQRLNDGTYGVCEDCGGEIPIQRLRALPTAHLCIECQRASDRESQTGVRPITL